ncbi:MAG: hypothetical protein WCS03_13005 [Bacteroidota bacterium]
MNSTKSFRVILINFFLMYGINLIAQPGLNIYTDLGMNNTSQGLIIKSSAMGCYKFDKNLVEAGYQVDLMNGNKNVFSGYTISGSKYLVIKDIVLELKGFFTRSRPSDILQETDWGGLLKMRHKHFEMAIGTNFRTYNFSQQAVLDFKIDNSTTKIHEIYNLMYSFSYYLKPTDDKWNVGLSVTNIDHFIINQETNPMFNLNCLYKLRSSVCLYAQAWYKIAGASNLEVNHFGFFVRTGIIWNFN